MRQYQRWVFKPVVVRELAVSIYSNGCWPFIFTVPEIEETALPFAVTKESNDLPNVIYAKHPCETTVRTMMPKFAPGRKSLAACAARVYRAR
jgi:hypothetical protein